LTSTTVRTEFPGGGNYISEGKPTQLGNPGKVVKKGGTQGGNQRGDWVSPANQGEEHVVDDVCGGDSSSIECRMSRRSLFTKGKDPTEEQKRKDKEGKKEPLNGRENSPKPTRCVMEAQGRGELGGETAWAIKEWRGPSPSAGNVA